MDERLERMMLLEFVWIKKEISGILLLRLNSCNYFVIFSIHKMTRRWQQGASSNYDPTDALLDGIRTPQMYTVHCRDANNSYPQSYNQHVRWNAATNKGCHCHSYCKCTSDLNVAIDLLPMAEKRGSLSVIITLASDLTKVIAEIWESDRARHTSSHG